MKLQALKTFSFGGQKLIFQGEEFDAPKSHSEEYIRLGLAKEIGSSDPEPLPFDSPPLDIARTDYTEEELQSYNMTELRKIAKNIGVTGYSTMSKSEIIFAIRGQQNINNSKLEA